MEEKTVLEWVIVQLDNTLELYNSEWDKISQIIEQGKQLEKGQLEKFYNHGQFAIIDNGHGDSFEDYYNKIFKTK